MIDPMKRKVIPAYDEDGNQLEDVSAEELISSLNKTAREMGSDIEVIGIPQPDGTIKITSKQNEENEKASGQSSKPEKIGSVKFKKSDLSKRIH